MMHAPRSLQARLLLLLLGLMAGVWLAAAALTWLDARHELDELLDGHLAQAAALLVVKQTGDIDDDAPGVDAPTLHRYAPKVAFQVFHEGRLSLRSANAPLRPMIEGAMSPSGFQTVQLDGQAWRVFAAQGAERDVRVFVGEQLASRAAILWAVLRSTLWPLLLALPLLALAAWWAVRRGTAPLRSIGRQLSARAPQALQPIDMSGLPDEMLPMIAALNDLFERISALMEAERRFTADAAHELRTPIAAIRAQAQVAMAETNDAARAHALQATLAGCDRATRLVEQMLTLARLEGGAAPALQPVALAELARSVVAELAPQALARQQQIEFDADGASASQVDGDATLLAVLVRNLVDNAIRYSPPQARLRVSVAASGRQLVLRVEDSGPGLSEPDALRLGERFFRVLGTEQSGSGLGWSIARRIAAVHGATLRVGRSTGLGGLAVEAAFQLRR